MNALIPIVIPAYEPDEKMIRLIEEIRKTMQEPIIVVDDGSGADYRPLFDQAAELKDTVVLRHAVNCGKGRGLKTAFNYILNTYPEAIGCVTIDSDGQHTCKDMRNCMKALTENQDALILGVRDFGKSNVPGRSSAGNKLTRQVMKILTGVAVTDTQTGLRVIPASFMRLLLNVSGERFEFETNMLIETKEHGIPIREIPIETIYLENNKTSHFNPLKDSFRIYAVFFKFLLSSGSSSVIDLVLFTLFCRMLTGKSFGALDYIFLSTVFARILSAIYNFLVNYKVVFKSSSNTAAAAIKYICLAVVIMVLSGSAVSGLHRLLPTAEILIKIPVDCILFLLSFFVQREFIYRNK